MILPLNTKPQPPKILLSIFRPSVLVSIAICFVPVCYGQTLTLDNILDSIELYHPSVKMYDAKIRSSDAAATGAKNWMPPQIAAGLWMTPYNSRLWKKDEMGNAGMGQYMISAEQMFPNKKYNEANEAYMKAMSSVEDENKQATLNDLFAAAKKSYYETIILNKKLSVLDESEKLLQFMITNAETRYKNGLGKISAYYKAKASLGDIGNMRIALRNEIIQRRIILNTLMNRDRSVTFELDTNYALKDYSTWRFDSTLFYNNRSDLKAIDRDVDLAYLQQKVEKESMKPQFGVEYDHMIGLGGAPTMFSLMGMMKLPLNWSTRMNKSNIESLKWKAVALQHEKESMANEYAGMADGMQADLAAKKQQVRLYNESILPALKKNYESMLLGYQQNTEELFELFDAWQALNNARLQYLDQLQELLVLQVELEKLLQVK